MNDKLTSIVKGAILALLGGGAAGMLSYLSGVDWSVLGGAFGGPLAGAAIAIILNIARKYLLPETPTTPTTPPTTTPAPVKPANPFGNLRS